MKHKLPDLDAEGIRIMMTQRVLGNMRATGGYVAKSNREFFARHFLHSGSIMKMAKVCHGTEVALAKKSHPEIISDVDALIATEKNLFIALTFADCAPVFLYDPAKRIVAVAHCSYKTILEDILKKTIVSMEYLGASRKNIRVIIGPGICRDCYEIQSNIVLNYFGYLESLSLRKGKIFADLRSVITSKLWEAGVVRKIYPMNDCTCCNSDGQGSPVFFSARREKMRPPDIKTGLAGIQLL